MSRRVNKTPGKKRYTPKEKSKATKAHVGSVPSVPVSTLGKPPDQYEERPESEPNLQRQQARHYNIFSGVRKRARMEIAIWLSGAIAGIFLAIGGYLVSFGGHRALSIWFFFPGLVFSELSGALYLQQKADEMAKQERAQATPAPTPDLPRVATGAPSPAVPQTTPAPKQSRFTEKKDRFEIRLGVNSAGFSADRPPQAVLRVNKMPAVTAQIDSGVLVVNANLFNATIRLVGDQLSGRPPSWQMNNDGNALEIVNADGLPMFQLIYLNEQLALVRGIFVANGGGVLVDDEGFHEIDPNRLPKKTFARIFKYPSSKHMGERD